MIHSAANHQDRTSDLVTGTLLLAVQENLITKVEASWFAVPFVLGAKLRKSTYRHEGNAFLGPDGLAIMIAGDAFGGAAKTPGGAYTLDNLITAPNYDAWFNTVMFRGSAKDEHDFTRGSIAIPKRRKDGSLRTGPPVDWTQLQFGAEATRTSQVRGMNVIVEPGIIICDLCFTHHEGDK
jgi:hypothetical protein